jgi:hypothetical protein
MSKQIELVINWVDRNGNALVLRKLWNSLDAAKWYVGEFQANNPGCYRSHTIN